MKNIKRVNEIEMAVAEGTMTAAQVFTQMLQLANDRPEFTALCHSKTKQIGSPVGFLVQNEAGGLAAVHNLGRVTWLDDCVAGPVEKTARAQSDGGTLVYRYRVIEDPQGWEYSTTPLFGPESGPGKSEEYQILSLDQAVSELNEQASAAVPDDSKHHAVRQAQMWAQETRTQKAIVKQIGEIVGCANDWEMVEAVRNALSNASGGSLQDCCCGETEQAWRLCPLHSAPPKQEQGQ
jgi:hypothetical protein